MNKKISNFEFATLNFFLVRAFLLGALFNALLNFVKQDSWIIPLLGIIPAFLCIIFLNYIMNYEPDLNIFDKLNKLFGPVFSKIVIVLFILYAFLLLSFNFLNLNNFIQSQFLIRTPLIFIAIMFAIATMYIVNKGFNTLSRTGVILFYIANFLFIFSLIGLIPVIKIYNLKPMFVFKINDYLKALNSFYSLSIVPMFMLSVIPKNKIKNAKIKKTLMISYFCAAITLFIIVIATIGTFGFELTRIFEYPEFHVLKYISLVDLTSRIESILVLQLVIDIFITNVFIVYYIKEGVVSIKKTNKVNIIYFIICILMIVSSMFISRYNIYIDKFFLNDMPFISLIFSCFAFFVICIMIFFKKKKS